MSNGIIKIRKTTGIVLGAFILLLAVVGALADFGAIDFAITASQIITAALILIVIFDVSQNAVLRRKFDAFEVIATIVVGISLIAFVVSLAGVQSNFLDNLSGFLKIALVLVAGVAIFTSGRGE